MLASIREIIGITEIPGSDNLELAHIDGWQVVVKKNQFKAGDLAGYIEIDTIAPKIPFFEFLVSRDYRIRSIKLCKTLSQGLIVSNSDVNQIMKELGTTNNSLIGIDSDITDLIGIKKYSKDIEISEPEVDFEPPIPVNPIERLIHKFKYRYLYNWYPKLRSKFRTDFPDHLVSRTNETNIQNLPAVLAASKGMRFVVSEKLNGSSMTVIYDKTRGFLFGQQEHFTICSRNKIILNTKSDWHRVIESTGFKAHIRHLAKHYDTNNIIVQGEYIGKTQGNYYKLDASQFRLFNIFVNGKRIYPNEFYYVCVKYMIPCCPKLADLVLDHTMDELLKYAEGPSVLNKDVTREGIVVRHDATSFKVVSNKYLLKNNE